MILPLQIPQNRSLRLLSEEPLSWFSLSLFHSPRRSKIPWDTLLFPATIFDLSYIFLAFSLHTLYRAFEGQSELFTWAFPSSHRCSSWSLYFENFSFHCSQANNHSSIASFSMQPHDPSHSPLPTSHISLSYTEGNLYFWSFTKEWWEVKYWISKREKKKFPEAPLDFPEWEGGRHKVTFSKCTVLWH